MLVKIRSSPNEIVILQYIAEEVDSFWVVPVGHAHCSVSTLVLAEVVLIVFISILKLFLLVYLGSSETGTTWHLHPKPQ